jgi:hypothetical protein
MSGNKNLCCNDLLWTLVAAKPAPNVLKSLAISAFWTFIPMPNLSKTAGTGRANFRRLENSESLR